MTPLEAAVQVGGGALVVSGAYITARIGASTSQRATDVTAKVQDKANEIDANDRLMKNMMARLERVEQRADELEDQVRALEDQRSRDHGLIRALWSYVQQLRGALIANKLPVPEPPGGLDLNQPLSY